MRSRRPSPCDTFTCGEGWEKVAVAVDNCACVPKFKPATLPKPKALLYLLGFSRNPAVTGSWCVPTYYAYRYYNVVTMESSPLSDWTEVPVQSGASTLPTPPPFFTVDYTPGPSTCKYNTLKLGVIDQEYALPVIAFLYRKTATGRPEPVVDMVYSSIHGQKALTGIDTIQFARHIQTRNACDGC